ncbi:GlcG/HbpS family heme-binding protein [Leifsonia sp. AG29]|uniref:GlcG/HbpS family heme-binding protein n=1 Tax=Leifsonia sp. AG29 TaxID=2598860 RepID=UPI00131CEBB9|nr:heme-binding protein [Leifsonia sp. AG29]
MTHPEPRLVADMSEPLASALIDGFRTECAGRGLALAVCVVDRSGSVVASLRLDAAQLPASELAFTKAFTAVAFSAPSSRWSASTAPGGSDWGLAGALQGRITPVAGGVPLFAAGSLVGAVGVSGTASAVDEEIATAVARSLGLETTP